MKITAKRILWITTFIFVVMLTGMTNVLAQRQITSVPSGQKLEVNGSIIQRDPDSFRIMTLDKATVYNVLLTSGTSVKANTKGVFRGGGSYEATYLLRGLRVQVVGTGNESGQLVADKIRFNEQDLKTAQALEARMEPLEDQVATNSQNITSNTGRISATEENAKRMAGQIDENTALANRAQATADAAAKEADRANNRINGLGEFDTLKTIVVPFATGSSTLGPKGKGIIDEAAKWTSQQDRTGWMIQVVGFADSTGATAMNKTLSEKRANAVIGYLVTKYNLPLHRLVQPFGAGVDMPAATNDTAAGRATNRRVEIKLLRNKGIAGE